MRKIFLLCLVVASFANAKEPVQSTTDKPEECVLVASMTNPKQKEDFPIQLCMYTHTEVRGIFAATACVAVLIESQTGTRHPFYGSKGHWGIEGTCDAKKITDKFNEKKTMTTVNPISDLKAKRKAGKVLEILKDDLGVGTTLLAVTKP